MQELEGIWTRGGVYVWDDSNPTNTNTNTNTNNTNNGGGLPHRIHMVAGAVAGVAEHVSMFPVDTIKTRMQVLGGRAYSGLLQAGQSIMRVEGFGHLWRGVSAVLVGVGPAHAVYFSTYELFKKEFGVGGKGDATHHPLAVSAAGMLATAAHDFLMVPTETVKQRMQMAGSERFGGIMGCIRDMVKREGLHSFWAGYPVTVLMNVPFTAIHFATYESMRVFLLRKDGQANVARDLLAGGVAGAVASGLTTPLDVVKTRLQTQGAVGEKLLGMRDTFQSIYVQEGWHGFWRGASARMLSQAPSAAICWAVYEGVKRLVIRRTSHSSGVDE